MGGIIPTKGRECGKRKEDGLGLRADELGQGLVELRCPNQ